MTRFMMAVLGFLILLIVSCKKDNSNSPNNPTPPRDYSKLKTFKSNITQRGSVVYSDSTSIKIDSVNNKIIVTTIDGSKDTSVATYTYNSNNQLVLYEQNSNYYSLYISKMQFIRDANGQLSQVLSEYKHGLMATSTGVCKYDKRGDTTFITFIDSTQKHPYGYPDANDYYQVGVSGGQLVYQKWFSKGSGGKLDSSVYRFSYYSTGNLTTLTYQYDANPSTVYTYQRGSQSPRELQKFVALLGGDIVWFQRSKLFNLLDFPDGNYFTLGSVVQSLTKNNASYLTYTNEFDASNNLKKMTYTDVSTGEVGTYQFEYWP
jgi:hypothetical protein